jgi:hypothetical protein
MLIRVPLYRAAQSSPCSRLLLFSCYPSLVPAGSPWFFQVLLQGVGLRLSLLAVFSFDAFLSPPPLSELLEQSCHCRGFVRHILLFAPFAGEKAPGTIRLGSELSRPPLNCGACFCPRPSFKNFRYSELAFLLVLANALNTSPSLIHGYPAFPIIA